MNEERQDNVVASPRILPRVVSMVLLACVVVSWLVWGLFVLVLYLLGLLNYSPWAFSPCFLLFLLTFVVPVYLPMRIVRTVSRRYGLDDRKWRRRLLSVIAVSAFVVSFLLAGRLGGCTLGNPWVWGFTRYIERRTDVREIQNWLGTLDPKDYILDEDRTDEKRFVGLEQPPCIATLRSTNVTVRPDDAEHLTVRLLWGGGFVGHWGIVVGPKDMPMPSSAWSNRAERRFPLAPGAYIWSWTDD